MRNLNFLFSNPVQGESDLTRCCPRDAFEMPLTCPRHLFCKMLILSMLLFLGIGNMWGATLDITASNFESSYSTSESTFSVSGYTIGYKNVMKNQNGTPSGWATSQIIQMRKNASTYGRLYNKSEITGLSKIRFWVKSGTTFQIYTGTSMIDDTPGSGALTLGEAAGSETISYTTYAKGGKTGSGSITLSYYDIDITNGDTYFYITTGNIVTAYIYKIEITYSTCTLLGSINGSISLSKGKRTDSPKQNQTQDNSYVWQKIG